MPRKDCISHGNSRRRVGLEVSTPDRDNDYDARIVIHYHPSTNWLSLAPTGPGCGGHGLILMIS